MKLFVAGCCKSHNPVDFGTFDEIYDAQRIRTLLNRFPNPKGILSYKHGLILENEVFQNYDQDHFTDLEYCATQVKEKARGREIVFYSPRPLVESPWLKLLKKAGVKFSIIRSYKQLRQN